MSKQTVLIQLTGGDLADLIANSVKTALAELPKPKEPEELLTRKQAAALIGVTLPTLHTYSQRGLIKTYNIGRNVRFKKSEVLESLRQVETLKYRR